MKRREMRLRSSDLESWLSLSPWKVAFVETLWTNMRHFTLCEPMAEWVSTAPSGVTPVFAYQVGQQYRMFCVQNEMIRVPVWVSVLRVSASFVIGITGLFDLNVERCFFAVPLSELPLLWLGVTLTGWLDTMCAWETRQRGWHVLCWLSFSTSCVGEQVFIHCGNLVVLFFLLSFRVSWGFLKILLKFHLFHCLCLNLMVVCLVAEHFHNLAWTAPFLYKNKPRKTKLLQRISLNWNGWWLNWKWIKFLFI